MDGDGRWSKKTADVLKEISNRAKLMNIHAIMQHEIKMAV